MVAKVAISEGQRPGSLFVPMHWNNQFARQGRVNNLLAAVTDPYSGQPGRVNRRRWRSPPWQPAWHSEAFLPRTATISLRPGTGGGGRRQACCTTRWPGRHLPDSGSARGAPGAAGSYRWLTAARCGTCWPGIRGRLMLGWWSDAREPAVDCAWISAAFAAAARPMPSNDMPCLAADRAPPSRRGGGSSAAALGWGMVN